MKRGLWWNGAKVERKHFVPRTRFPLPNDYVNVDHGPVLSDQEQRIRDTGNEGTSPRGLEACSFAPYEHG